MNNGSRTKKAVVNASFGMGMQFVIVLCQFVLQTVFIKTLNAEYLGLNGVFSNVLQFLSLAELGIGGAITFTLFKPLADKDEGLIRATMNLYKSIYAIIGLIVFVMGIMLSFSLNWFIKPDVPLGNVQLMFILYLMNSVVSYFFAYCRTLLIADQKSYIDSINQAIFRVLQVILQGVFLIVTHEYILFLVVQIIVTIVSNYSIYAKTIKVYPFLKNKDKSRKIPREVIDTLKKNAMGAFSAKIGSIVVFGTANVLISKFVGLAAAGLFSNYMLLLNSVSGLMNKAINSVAASIANFINSKDESKIDDVFFEYMYVVSFCALISGLLLSIEIQPFIRFWVGSKYELPKMTVALIIFNWILNLMRNTVLSFMAAYGAYWEVRWKSIIEAALNLSIGVLLITTTNLGINAVVISGIAVGLAINAWVEPWILFRKSNSFDKGKYITRYIVYLCAAVCVAFVPVYLPIRVPANMLAMLISSILVSIIFTLLFIALTSKFSESNRFKKMISSKISNRLGRLLGI